MKCLCCLYGSVYREGGTIHNADTDAQSLWVEYLDNLAEDKYYTMLMIDYAPIKP